jgi:MFS family permease
MALGQFIQGMAPSLSFYYGMLLGRFLAGIGDAQVLTNSYIYILDMDDNDKYIGYMEASIGVGFVIGPVLGSSLYEAFGITQTQYTMMIFPIIGLFLTF